MDNVVQKVALEACIEKFSQNHWRSRENGNSALLSISQNHELRNALMETGHKILVEVSTDWFWGIGISLNDRNILNDSSWTGKKVLGQVLTQMRDQLK